MRKILLSLCLMISTTVHAEDLMPRTPKTFLGDGLYTMSAPFRIERESFKWAAGAVVVTVGSSLLDRTIRDHFFPSMNTTGSKDLRLFGDGVQVLIPVMGTGFLWSGSAHDDDKSKETGYLLYEGFVWSAVIGGGLSYIVGRERPLTTDNPYSFTPFSGNSSFPSGHTTQAFAAATVLSEQYPHWYVAAPAYSVATVTGFSRLYASKHWMSDVVGGAMLGMFIAHTIRFHRRRLDKKEQAAWDLSTNGSNLLLVRRF